jgi:hypothetical protein
MAALTATACSYVAVWAQAGIDSSRDPSSAGWISSVFDSEVANVLRANHDQAF